MAYHRLPNIGETLQGDIVGKLRKGIGSKVFPNREFNCNSTAKVKGTCAYRGEYRACGVFYMVTCRQHILTYVVNRKNNLKNIPEQ